MPLEKHSAVSRKPDFSPGPASTQSSCKNLLGCSTDPLIAVVDGNGNKYSIEKRLLVAKSSVLAAKCTSDQIYIDDFSAIAISTIVQFMKTGKYELPTSIPGFAALAKPPPHVHGAASLHRANVVDNDETVVLRRNRGHVALTDLVGHRTPNIKAHLEIFGAAQKYHIAGLHEAAIARFQESVLEFRGHPEVESVLKEGLPFSLEL